MWTHYRRESDIVRAVVAGASGLILAPDDTGPGLLEAILGATQGISYMPQETLTRLRAVAGGQALSSLAEGERALLGLVLDGRQDAEIGLELGFSSEEAAGYVARILEKLL
jgi:DNA-binding NarL/FixJ family response regulator